ncbi:Amino acid permease 2 [Zea mays]|uniref:Amino acid permease 2 n=1 Tax=Zea mays TaxID=4577 RepID=A0A1D6EH27_MAIZE|nr:Amino acid permease 2 [Zea mays]
MAAKATGHVGTEAMEVSVEVANGDDDAARLDDDGRPRRRGTMWTASAHIITAVIGAGVLSLAWAMAQLGWAAGTAMMLLFAGISYYTSTLLAECYRCGEPGTGKRNYTYTEAVRAILGGAKFKLCGVIQYANLVGIAVGYTIAASISMLAIKRADCFHDRGHRNPCRSSSNPYMILFGAVEIVFSQIPDFDQIWWLSIVAAAMSFTYATIGLALGIAQTVANGGFKGSLTGVNVGDGITPMQKDTIKAPPPSEVTVMKKATMVSVATTTVFYMLCGCMGYAAFGDDAPDNLLTGFGFYEPFWLLDVANAAIVVHLVGAYQVFCQPLFAFVEKRAAARWPDSRFMTRELRLGPFVLGVFRLTWRTAFVCLTTVVAMMLPFFGDVVGLLGAVSFWPLSVYFPVEMYKAQRRVRRWSTRWLCLQTLSAVCLLVSIAGAVGSTAGVINAVNLHRPFSG